MKNNNTIYESIKISTPEKYKNAITKNGILYTSNYDIDLSNPLFRNIKQIYIIDVDFDLNGLNKLLNKRSDIIILIKFPTIFEPEEKENLYQNKNKYKNVFFVDDKLRKYSVEDLIKLDEYMDLMIKDIKESNLSPYERFIAVYNIVKSYKTYIEAPVDYKGISRNEYMFLMSDYAVCVGYVMILKNLLSKVGINSDDIVCHEDHEIIICHIKDPKYNIDSFQLCDPTSDSIIKKYTQNPLIKNFHYLNMTLEEAKNYYESIDLFPLLREDNKEIMLKYLKLKFGQTKLMYIFNKISKRIDITYILEKPDQPMNVFLELLNLIGEDSNEYNLDNAQFAINYIKEKTNQQIDQYTKLTAIYNVYRFINNNSNNNYADFVIDNFSFKKYFKKIPIQRVIDIDNLELIQVLNIYINSLNIYTDVNAYRNIANKTISVEPLYYSEKALYDLGIVPYGDKLLLRNSLFTDINNISSLCSEENGLNYNEEMNNLYLTLNETIAHMKYIDFKNYIHNLVSNINSKRRL